MLSLLILAEKHLRQPLGLKTILRICGSIWKKNVPAQRLYERSGFVRTGSKTFVFGSDVQQDAVYSRSL